MYSEIEPSEKLDVKNCEPNKCEKWLWVSFNQLRINLKRLFYPLQDFLNKYENLNSVEELKKLVKFSVKNEDNKPPVNKGSINSASCDESTFEGDSVITKEDLYLDI